MLGRVHGNYWPKHLEESRLGKLVHCNWYRFHIMNLSQPPCMLKNKCGTEGNLSVCLNYQSWCNMSWQQKSAVLQIPLGCNVHYLSSLTMLTRSQYNNIRRVTCSPSLPSLCCCSETVRMVHAQTTFRQYKNNPSAFCHPSKPTHYFTLLLWNRFVKQTQSTSKKLILITLHVYWAQLCPVLSL